MYVTPLIEIPKRHWCYVQPPSTFGVPACPHCGNQNTQWSEWKDYLWCAKCNLDVRPEHWGLFDGPIMIHTCNMLGISFDRINFETNQYEEFRDIEDGSYCDWIARTEDPKLPPVEEITVKYFNKNLHHFPWLIPGWLEVLRDTKDEELKKLLSGVFFVIESCQPK